MKPTVGLKVQNSKLRNRLRLLFDAESIEVCEWPSHSTDFVCVTDSLSDEVINQTNPVIFLISHPTYQHIHGVINSTINSIVNKGKDLVLFTKEPDAKELCKIVEELFHEKIGKQKNILLSKEINLKNRQLDQMNSDLEKIVEQRTSTVAEEKKEAEAKQRKIKKLVEFVQRLSVTESMSEYLDCIRREFRSHFGVTEVFFTSKDLIGNLKEFRLTLANRLARPVGRLCQLDLAMRTDRLETNGVCLLIEHGMDDETLPRFFDFVSDRTQMMSLALERIYLFDELTKSSVEWENTFDTLSDPVGIVDVDYRLLRSNNSFGEPAFRSSCFKIFAGNVRPCEGCPVALSALTATPQVGQVKKNGRFFKIHSYPIKMSQDKTVTTVVNHYVDITEDRQLYSRVIQHEKMTALGIMAGHIAHELNNPLTGIRSLCQVLKLDKETSEGTKKDLLEIELASERCQIIIKNLLEFTLQRDEVGVAPVSLNEVVQKTLPMLKTAMRYHSCFVELSKNEKLVSGNSHLLQQVVFNLVNNSCQAMPNPGEVKIETRLERGNMILEISDTGTGITLQNVPRLFEAFFTTKPIGEGTGLGLSMSRSIVEKLGGKIRLVETGPKGSKFEISFRGLEQ